jgi:hypothetical protein
MGLIDELETCRTPGDRPRPSSRATHADNHDAVAGDRAWLRRTIPHRRRPHRQVIPPSRSAKPLRQVTPPSRSAKSLSPGERVAKGRERGREVAGKDKARLRSNQGERSRARATLPEASL